MLPPGLQDDSEAQVPHHEPVSPIQPPSVRSSAPSHVPIDFFDPTGVHELHRTFTQQSHPTNPTDSLRIPPKEDASPSSATTVIGDDDFDFAKHLKYIIKR
jgi:hypothetical protein